jgi:hypothetical protein
MGKTQAHRARHDTRHKKSTDDFPRSVTSDVSIYIGLIIIGFAAVGAIFLLTEQRYWREAALGYCAAMAWLINLYAWKA